MTATATDKPTKRELLFDQEVIIDGRYRLKVRREVRDGDQEEIVGTVPSSYPFGDWRAEGEGWGEDPAGDAIARDVGKAMNTELVISAVFFETDDRITLKFQRKAEAPPDSPAKAKNGAKATKRPGLKPRQKSSEEAFIDRVTELEQECSAADAKWLSAKEKASELKQIAEGKHSELCTYIRDFTKPLPLFDKKPKANGVPPAPSPVGDAQVLAALPITELGLPKGTDIPVASR